MKKIDLKEEYFTKEEAELSLVEYNRDKDEIDKFYYSSYFNTYRNRWMYCICTKQQWYDLQSIKRGESKRIDLESRCLIFSERYGTKRCMEDCNSCPFGKTKREGNPLSYDKALEDGVIIDSNGCSRHFFEQADPSSDVIENHHKNELYERMYELIDELGPEDKKIIQMYMKDDSDSEIAKALNSKKTTIQYRRTKIFAELKIKLEKYL